MANLILPKFSAPAALTITLGGLANSSAGVGRQSTMVDNTTTRYKRIFLFAQVKLGTTPTVNTLVTLYLLRYDTTSIRTDGAGASDAGLTVKNAVPIGTLTTGAATATGDVLKGDFLFSDPGPNWGIAVVNGSGVALDSTNGNHVINWLGENPEVQ